MPDNLIATKHANDAQMGCVYVVEDDDGMRNSINTALALLGYKVCTFKNPLEFLALDFLGTPAVLITDMKMSEISGIDLQATLLERGNHMPIIFVSGQSTLEQGLTAMKRGAIEFLLKPFSREDLIKAVAKAIDIDITRLQTLNKNERLNHLLKTLTKSELEIFRLLEKGFNNQEIVRSTGLTLYTVKNYKTKVMQKLSIKTLAELILLREKHVSPE